MSTPTTKPHDLARAVVSDPNRIGEWAAWELLHAVNELFPDHFDDLRAIGSDFELDLRMDPESVGCTLDDLESPNPPYELFDRVSKWTAENNISCDTVDDVATRFAWGLGPTLVLPYSACFSWLAIHARPESETRGEFVKRAEKHYDDMTAILLRIKAGGGFRKGPFKRQHKHFRYLAAFLVGEKTWEEIARDETELRKRTKPIHAKIIAEAAHDAACMIEMPMPTTPGPRPGSRLRPAEHRVHRSARR